GAGRFAFAQERAPRPEPGRPQTALGAAAPEKAEPAVAALDEVGIQRGREARIIEQDAHEGVARLAGRLPAGAQLDAVDLHQVVGRFGTALGLDGHETDAAE